MAKAKEEITLNDIQAVRDELKKITTKWAIRLAAKVFPDEEISIARERLYNIVNGSNRSSDSRIAFVMHAQDLKEELINEAEGARGALKNILTKNKKTATHV